MSESVLVEQKPSQMLTPTRTSREAFADVRPERAIGVENLSKMYKVYSRASHLFWETLTGKPRHEEFWALRDISFEIARGQVVGLIGRNGAGKSTMLRILAGTLDKTSGSVEINGKISAILELGTGFHPERTGRENIYMGGLCLGMTKKEVDAKIDQIIEFSELEEFIDRPFKTYSSGMQARLTFSTAISVEPDIFIVDEALATGDALFQEKCMRRIHQICRSGATVLLVTHSLFHIFEMCSACLLFHQGRLLDYGDPRRIGERYERLLFYEDRPKALTSLPSANAFQQPDSASVAGDPAIGSDASTSEKSNDMPARAEVQSMDIRNEKNEPVFNLLIGEKYAVVMTVQFNDAIPHASLSFSIQKETGLVVTGDTTHAHGIELTGLLGKQVTVEFSFVCRLLAGTYLMSGGVTELLEGNDFRVCFLGRGLFSFNITGRPLNGLFDPDCRVSLVSDPKIESEAA